MTRWIRFLRIGLVTLGFALGAAAAANAQVIAEYLFWDSVGRSAGAAMKHHAEYRAERELWARKIVEAKAALARCGDCPAREGLQKELARWQRTENQFQEIAGAAAAAVGMPPNVAKWLGIDAPMAPPPSRAEWERRHRVVRPAWVDKRPPFCRQAADAHLQCLRDYQTRTGSLPTDVAKNPGGACYESSKFFRHCYSADYDAFEREKALRTARAAGRIIPEYVEGSAFTEVYYGQVPDTFVPALPPDIVRAAFKERPAGIRLSTRKSGTGFVDIVRIEPFMWHSIAPSSTCFSGERKRGEIERRVCDDLSTLSFKERAPLLSCRYGQPGGESVDASETWFWFDGRPATADPKRLLSRSSDHPALAIGEPRTSCPVTRRDAERAGARWAATVTRMRAETSQLASNVALPESTWRTTAREANRVSYEAGVARGKATQGFPFEGTYSFETTLPDGASLSGRCVMSSAGTVKVFYLLQCRHGAGETILKATLFGGHLQTNWSIGGERVGLVYQVDESSPDTLVANDSPSPASSGRLVRTGDLVPLADFPVTGMYRLELSAERGTESGRCTISRDERTQRPAFQFECTTDGGQSFTKIAQHSENAIFVSWPTLARVPLNELAFVVADEEAAGKESAPLLIGGNETGASVRLIRTGDLASASGEAP